MRTATITQAKAGLSALIDEVRAGNSVVILDRGVPVATLEPIASHADLAGRIQRLHRQGVLRPPTRPIPLELIRQRPPRTTDGVSVVDALLEERRTGR